MTKTVNQGQLRIFQLTLILTFTKKEYINPKQTLNATGGRDIGVLLAAYKLSTLLFFENHLGIFIDIYGRASLCWHHDNQHNNKNQHLA